MGLDLEFQRTASTGHTYRGESPLARMVHDMRGSLKNLASEQSFHSEGMTKGILSAIAKFLTIKEDIEICYHDNMQSFAERFEWEILAHTEAGQENDPAERMRVMEMVMKFQDHSAEDLKAFMESDAYKGYQGEGKQPQRTVVTEALDFDTLS